MKGLLLSQSAFYFLTMQGLISLFLLFLKNIWSRESFPESTQRHGVILVFSLSFCAHITLFLSELKHSECQTARLTRGLTFLWRGQKVLLPCLSTSFLWDLTWKNGHRSGTTKNPQKPGCNTTAVWGKPVPFWSGVEKIQSTRMKSRGQSTTRPCQRWNGLIALILARLWTGFVDIFLKKSDCSVHIPTARDTLYLFCATLQEEFVLLSQSQRTSLKFLNQGQRFMQYQRGKGKNTNPPSLQWSLSNALTLFLPGVPKLPGT